MPFVRLERNAKHGLTCYCVTSLPQREGFRATLVLCVRREEVQLRLMDVNWLKHAVCQDVFNLSL